MSTARERLQNILAPGAPALVYRAEPLRDAIDFVGKTLALQDIICADARDGDAIAPLTVSDKNTWVLVLLGHTVSPQAQTFLGDLISRHQKVLALTPALDVPNEVADRFLACVAFQWLVG